MKFKKYTIKANIDDNTHELLLNLAAQGYYAECYELILKVDYHFKNSLLKICVEAMDIKFGK